MLPLWHLLHSYNNLELEINQTRQKWQKWQKMVKKRKQIFATRMGFEPGTALGVALIIEAFLKNLAFF